MLDGLPKSCDMGVRTNARRVLEKRTGYKLHVDAGGGGVIIDFNRRNSRQRGEAGLFSPGA